MAGGGRFGGGGGTGGMFRMPKRVSRTGLSGGGGSRQDPISPSTENRAKKLSIITSSGANSPTASCSSPTSSLSLSVSSAAGAAASQGVWQLYPSFADEFDWEYLDNDDENGVVCEKDVIFEVAPSVDEVEHALASLRGVFSPASVGDVASSNQDMDAPPEPAFSPVASIESASSIRSELDWIEPPWQLYEAGLMQINGINSVYDALNLCATEPVYQDMVISLSSDKAVWTAVMNNEVVRDLREKLNKAKQQKALGSSGGSQRHGSTAGVLGWIFQSMKAKFMDAVANITNLVGGLFQNHDHKCEREEEDDVVQQKLKTSFMLTILVIFIVVLDRASTAS